MIRQLYRQGTSKILQLFITLILSALSSQTVTAQCPNGVAFEVEIQDCLAFTFDNTSVDSADIDSSEWRVDGALIETFTGSDAYNDFTHTFAAHDTDYEVELTVFYNNSTDCSTSETYSVAPIAGTIGVGAATFCSNESLDFYANQASGNGSLSYDWTVNGSNFTDSASTVTFANPNLDSETQTLQLTITDSVGCELDITRDVTVVGLDEPNIGFPNDQCNLSTVSVNAGTRGVADSYAWTFDDGDTSTDENPSHTINLTKGINDTNYQVTLTTTNTVSGVSCTASDTINRRVYAPLADFTFTDSICGNIAASFTNASQGGQGTRTNNWDFGVLGISIDVSTDASPQYTYPSNQTTGRGRVDYEVELEVEDGVGCTDIIEKTITIIRQPAANFTQGRLSGDNCSGVEYNFDPTGSTANNSNISYTWDYGNSITSSRTNAHDFTYNLDQGDSTSNFTPTLTVTNTVGSVSCSDVETGNNIQVQRRPIADFSFTNDDACAGTYVAFTEEVGNDNGAASYSWDFGNDSTATNANPQVKYDLYGPNDTHQNFDVRLVATLVDCSDEITKSVRVRAKPTMSALTVSPTGSVCSGTELTFGITQPQGQGLSYEWDFGDGSSTQNRDTASHTHNANGIGTSNFTYQLTLTNNQGCDSVLTGVKSVIEVARLDFRDASRLTPPWILCTNEDSLLNASEQLTIRYNENEFTDRVLNYLIEWGNGEDSLINDSDLTGRSIRYTYNGLDNYNISITANESTGCSSTFTADLVFESNPVPLLSVPGKQGCEPFDLGLINQSYRISDSTRFLLRFGDGKDTVYYLEPTPNGRVSNTINHTYFSSCSLENDTIAINGYKAELIAFNNGCSDTTDANIRISEVDPIDVYRKSESIFTVTDVACKDNTLSFDNQSIPPTCSFADTVSYYWDFGDGNDTTIFSTGATVLTDIPDVAHAYDSAGMFIITLTISDNSTGAFNCGPDTAIRTINVFEAPTPGWDVTAGDTCFNDPNLTWAFAATSTEGIGSVESGTLTHDWEVTTLQGGGIATPSGATSVDNFSVTFDNTRASVYRVRMIASNICGTDTLDSTIVIKGPPVVTLDPIPDTCSNYTYLPRADYVDNFDSISSYQWTFDQPNPEPTLTRNIQNPDSIFFGFVGSYTVTASATNGCGTDSDAQSFELFPIPDAFVVPDDSICRGESLNIGGTAVASNTYAWNPITGLDDHLIANPVATPDTTTSYILTETIASSGCTNKDTVTITVNQLPQANFSANTICLGEQTDFTDLSTVTSADQIDSWSWDFDDGNNSNLQNPQHTYANAGLYDVTLTVTDDNGCTHTITRQVRVRALPIPDFTFRSACLGDFVTFQDASTPADDISQWAWSFGEGSAFSTAQNPSYDYASAGTFQVRLAVTDVHDCQDSIERPVSVDVLPIANFTIADVCRGTASTLVDQSTSSATALTNWAWQWGDGRSGSSTTRVNPTNTYASVGDYDVTLTVTNAAGCVDDTTITTTVNPAPIANFGVAPVCLGETSQFTNTAVSPNGAVLTNFQWNFGDGASSTDQNPSHVYTTADTFNVSLTVADANGCSHTIIKQAIVRPLPDVRMNISNACDESLVAFTDRTAVLPGGGDLSSWYWRFGDGDTSVLQNPSHEYPTFGVYPVDLVVTDEFGCQDSVGRNAEVFEKPRAGFAADSVCFGIATPFTDQSQVGGGPIQQWNWEFGNDPTNPASSSLRNPSFTYPSAGTYAVRLEVTDNNGCTDLYENDILVFALPVTNFLASTACLNDTTRFTDDSQSTSSTISSYLWNFGDGTGTATAQDPNYVYSISDTFPVTLITTDANNCSSQSTKNVFVRPLPIPDFVAPADCNNAFIDFDNLSSIAANGGNITAWRWAFGDGNTSNAFEPSHRYDGPGAYNTTLTATDQFNCAASRTRQAEVFENPEANFSHTTVCVNNATSFINAADQGDANIVGYRWDFGDGVGSSMLANPSYTYASAGTFQVNLQVTDANGCTDDTTISVTVHPLPTPGFSSTVACVYDTTEFTNTSFSTGTTTVAWFWDFGDGSGSSTAENPRYAYQSAGTFRASMTVTDARGCQTSIARDVIVNPLPEADFKAEDVPLGQQTNFTDSSTSSVGIINQWSWDFADGNTSTLRNPTHTYGAVGVYSVELEVVNSNGCKDSVIKDVTVFGLPVPDFVADTVCEGQVTSFTDRSTETAGAIQQWSWDFGDGRGSSMLRNPKYTYDQAGVYNVRLTITDINGTVVDTIKSVVVDTLPLPNFVSDVVCLNDTTEFQNTSVGRSSPLQTSIWDFGDNIGTSVSTSPSYRFRSSGLFNTQLTVIDANGCVDSITKTVTVNSLPIVSFTSNEACLNDSTFFTDISSGRGVPLVDWAWSFGDGNTSTRENPSNLYPAAGVFPVSLEVENSNGCRNSGIQNIRVNPLPDVDISVTANCFEDTTFFQGISGIDGSNVSTWDWAFGDNSGASTFRNPRYVYQDTGIYQVRLEVIDTNTCRNNTVETVEIFDNPTVGFTSSAACVGAATNFTDQTQMVSGAAITTWVWDFGDGNSSNAQNPVHTYAAPGSYSVSLTVTDARGCSETLIRTLVVRPLPVPDFVASTACQGDSTSFVDASIPASAPLNSWIWSLGDGKTTTGQLPFHLYPSSGNYNVRLSVRDTHGCAAAVIKTVRVNRLPVAAFDPSPSCEGSATFFQNNSTSQDAQLIVIHEWDFGDNLGRSGARNPQYTFGAAGIYPVELAVRDTNGCADTIVKNVVVDTLPRADFTYTAVCEGQETQFFDNSFSSAGLRSWSWDFGDSSAIQTGATVTHTFRQARLYNVTMTVTDNNGCTSVITKSIRVRKRPIADFTVNTACFRDSTRFFDRSIGVEATVDYWIWDMGNGIQIAGVQNPVYLYPHHGSYFGTLVAVDTNGCRDTVVHPVEVKLPPTVRFTSDSACFDSPTQFTDQSTGTSSLQFWNWNFGDGTTSNQRNPDHIFQRSGTFNVTLTVSDQNNCTSIGSGQAFVRKLPIPDFIFTGACPGEATEFTNQSTDAGAAGISGYAWQFGDGGTSTAKDPDYVYANHGDYVVNLRVTDSASCSADISKSLNIAAPPVADFSGTTVCLGDSTVFTNRSTSAQSTIARYTYDFGDGTPFSSRANPKHVYANEGTYQVTLIVEDVKGCADTVTRSVVVRPSPTASFSSNSDVCFGETARFTDQSGSVNGNITDWEWRFGDGSSASILQNPNHRYTQADTFLVSLEVTDNTDCQASVAQLFVVKPLPTSAFTSSVVCLGDATSFFDAASSGNTNLASWYWDFGGGNTSTAQNPQFTFSTAGPQDVTQVVTDALGCRDTITDQAFVNRLPNAAFEIADTCLTDNTAFTNLSTETDAPIASYLWAFGDGNTSSVADPQHVYAVAGNYQVELLVRDGNSCEQVATRFVRIQPLPVADFSVEDVCDEQQIEIEDLSAGVGGAVQNWLYTFGDGIGSTTTAEPDYLYASPGTFTIRQTVTDVNGCRESITKDVEIFNLPQAGFSASFVCFNEQTAFTNKALNGSHPITNWSWSFGDGGTSTARNPLYTYATPGTKTVTQTVTDAEGCSSSITDDIYVNRLPVPTFSVTDTCFEDTTSFSSLSVGTDGVINSYQWSFGNGATSTQINPRNYYNADGLFTVRLRVADDNGCEATTQRQVRIQPLPTANFDVEDVCFGQSVNVTDQAIATGGSIVGWNYDFGDNIGTDNTPSPSYLYTQPDTFDITQRVEDVNGCAEQVVKSVVVFEVPEADFEATRVCQGQQTRFTDISSSGDANLTTWSWDFGDGNSSGFQNPTHTYAMAGVYSVTLTITDAEGCTHQITKNVTVDSPPTPSFSVDNVCRYESMVFANTSIGSGGNIIGYRWQFGDGDSSTQVSPTHLYANAGDYTVTLTATDINNCEAQTTTSVTVYRLPNAKISYDDRKCQREVSPFASTSLNGDGQINDLRWDLGDGIGFSNDASFNYVYAQTGVFPVSLRVEDEFGCRDTANVTVEVLSLPTARLDFDQTCVNEFTTFTDQSTIADTLLTTWDWEFADGNTSGAQSPNHRYLNSGLYNVRLTVTDAKGCFDDTSRLVEVFAKPVASFSVPDVCKGETSLFTNTSTTSGGAINTSNWSFGDGNSSTAENPTNRYTLAGRYPVTLMVSDVNNCRDTAEQFAFVREIPQAFFTASDVCLNESVAFRDSSLAAEGVIDTRIWNFGDGSGGSGLTNPTYQFATADTFDVSLTVINSFGCQNTFNEEVVTHPLPVAGLIADSVCYGNLTQFTHLSQSGSTNIPLDEYFWSFGDGNTDNIVNPNHLYDTSGVYNASLTVTDAEGCSASATQDVIVYTLPEANFTRDSLTCIQGQVQFNDASLGNSSDIAAWDWDFGNNSGTSLLQNPVYSYPNSGEYFVKLVISDQNACEDSIEKNLIISDLPIAQFAADSVCQGNPTSFTDLSSAQHGSIVNHVWDFGDGNVSTEANPQHIYANAGTFNATLTVRDVNGCERSITKVIRVYANPVADFDADSVCLGSGTSFTDLSAPSALISDFRWNFGDGSPLVTSQNPVHFYADDSVYSASLRVENTLGCFDEITQLVIVHETPTADFTFETECANDTVAFQSAAFSRNGNVTAWDWDFDDGQTSDLENPNKVFSTAGLYQVNLRVADDKGCEDDITLPVAIDTIPVAQFTATTECEGDATIFTNTSFGRSNPLSTFEWRFGNGATSNDENPTYEYPVFGIYQVSLTVTDAGGCSHTVTNTVEVKELPEVDFVADTACFGQVTTFTDQTRSIGGRLNGWSWDFDDGAGDVVQNPTHLFGDQDSYDVRLEVDDINGCRNTIIKTVLVNPLPIPRFTADTTCLGDVTFLKDLSFSGGGDVTAWTWRLGDGSLYTTQNVAHVFASSATHNVKLIATDVNGCQDSILSSIRVNPLPEANFSATKLCIENATSFQDLSISDNGDIVGWDWRFGDGSGSSLSQNPNYTYTQRGDFDVRLTATDVSGCSSDTIIGIYIDTLPAVDFDAPPVCYPDTTDFENLSEGADNNLYSWFWYFDDGNTSTEASPTHFYTFNDTFNVRLEVIDIDGCENQLTKPVIVHTPPVADFERDSVCDGVAADFENISYNIESGVASVLWEFGDGTTSTDYNPSPHLYNKPGEYDVRLTLTNTVGCTDSVTYRSMVWALPNVDFFATQECEQEATKFTDLTEVEDFGGALTEWDWDFDDNIGTSIQQNPSYTFPSHGYYDVKLVVTDQNLCMDSLTKQVEVDTLPVADFSFNKTCFGDTVDFKDLSFGQSSNVDTWFWDFGDTLGTSTEKNPAYAYDQTGIYFVKLIVTDLKGCTDTVIKEAIIHDLPVANFRSDSVCQGVGTPFDNLSYSTFDSLETYEWDFGDGRSSNQFEPVHLYANAGNYTAKLRVITDEGCADEIRKPVVVHFNPETDFVSTRSCEQMRTIFTDKTISRSGQVLDWFWNYDDGGATSAQQNPEYIFTQAGKYDVTLRTTTNFGCVAIDSQEVIVDTLPSVDFTASNFCFSQDTVQFTDLSRGRSSVLVAWFWEFGDSTTSTLQNPQHFYDDIGTYRVTLTVTDTNGCENSYTKMIEIQPNPVAQFDYSTTCFGQATTFDNLSYIGDGSLRSVFWNFGDGDTSSVFEPTHIFTATDTFNVFLRVTSDQGCIAETIEQVVVHPLPNADFSANRTCFATTTFFEDKTIPEDATIEAWNWDLGNGATRSVSSFGYVYGNPNTYQVTLEVVDTLGCRDTVSYPVIVDSLPVSSFKISKIEACERDSVYFEDLSDGISGIITDWNWDFGNRIGTSNLQNAWYAYPDSGRFEVQLTITNDRGCTDSISQVLPIYKRPIVDFVADSVCFGDTTRFTNLSSQTQNPLVSYVWRFGDGNNDDVMNPLHPYGNPGDYRARLIATDDKGCTVQRSKDVFVWRNPVADFSADTACFSNATQFFDESALGDANINRWFYDFGDGSTSTQQHPLYTYPRNGAFRVDFTVTDRFGCADDTSKLVVVDTVPTVLFDAQPVCLGTESQFFDLSQASPGKTIVRWYWDFGDGDTSMLPNPVHTYAFSGTYFVTLTVEDDQGCTNSVTLPYEVWPQPSASFNVEGACEGQFTQFTDESIVNNSGFGNWYWDFGDGSPISNEQHPAHRYLSAGTYAVQLVVESGQGCTDTTLQNVVVSPRPTADFTHTTVCQGNEAEFFDQSTEGDYPIRQWDWLFGDDSLGTSTARNPRFAFENSGFHNVTLVIVDENLCRDTVKKPVQAYPEPTANFIADRVCFGEATSFTDQSTAASGAIVVGWDYRFGNPNDSSNLPSPSFRFASADTFFVSLTATDSRGCENTVVKPVIVEPLPVVDFSITSGCVGSNTQFTDFSFAPSGDSLTFWQWDFGDGTTSGLRNPAHTYASTGLYNVTLTVTSSLGCQTSVVKTIEIKSAPVAEFRANDVCQGFNNTFTDLSSTPTGTIDFWDWQFGDGNGSSLQNPTHAYSVDGTFNVQLAVMDSRGCTDTVVKPVLVRPAPDVSFTFDQTCFGLDTRFSSTSSSANGALVTQQWDLGDGTAKYVPAFNHLYGAANTYTVKLVVQDIEGCRDSISRDVTINPLPVVDFDVSEDSICQNRSITFTNLSTGASTFGWAFGDGARSNETSPTHTYTEVGQYQVSLVATSDSSCQDSVAKTVEVIELPLADFQINNNRGCGPLKVFFLNRTDFADAGPNVTYSWDFGNGQSSASRNPAPVDFEAGLYDDTTYVITLSVFTACGVTSHQDTVTVYPDPTAQFSLVQDPLCSPSTVSLTNESFGLVTGYEWDFGDSTTSTLQNPPQRVYTTEDDTVTYTIKLKTTNRCGVDSAERSFEVYPNDLIAFFNTNATFGCAPHTVQFTNFTVGTRFVRWDFGDGTTLNSGVPNPTHTFTEGGNYTVRMFVDDGCSFDTAYQLVRVFDQPDIQFVADEDTICVGDTVRFDNQTSGLGSTFWSFGDGGLSRDFEPEYIYTNPGVYVVSLQGTTALDGCTGEGLDTIIVRAAPRAVIAASDETVCEEESFVLSNFTSGAIRYDWSMGNGVDTTFLTSGNWTYAYPDSGSFKITMTATAPNGCTDQAEISMYASPKPIVRFTQSVDSLCGYPHTVSFDNQTLFGDSYTWRFGNGRSRTTSKPSVSSEYDTAGVFVINLSSRSSEGCFNEANDTLRIFEIPQPDFIASALDTCQADQYTFEFINNSRRVNDTAVAYTWTYGDGTTDTTIDGERLYSRIGTYQVSLNAVNNGFCPDTATKTVFITVHPNPVADFGFNEPRNMGIACGTMEFIDASIGRDSTVTWNWNFGDETGDFEVDTAGFIHRYEYSFPPDDFGNIEPFEVSLLVENEHGCQHDTVKLVDVQRFVKGLFIPNALMPTDNNSPEDYNLFKPKGVGLSEYHMQVFDKWGMLVWESKALDANGSPTDAWNGRRFNTGELLPAGGYVWQVDATYRDGTPWQGQGASLDDSNCDVAPINPKKIGTVTLVR